MPTNLTTPIIMVGPGTGIAPFRAFWQERHAQVENENKTGKMWLFFGCRERGLDLYRDEKADMINKRVLDKLFLALSRDPNVPKVIQNNHFNLFFIP